ARIRLAAAPRRRRDERGVDRADRADGTAQRGEPLLPAVEVAGEEIADGNDEELVGEAREGQDEVTGVECGEQRGVPGGGTAALDLAGHRGALLGVRLDVAGDAHRGDQ